MFFDYFLIIESLPEGETKTGNELYTSIIRRRAEQIGFGSRYVHINDFEEFKSLCGEIVSVCNDLNKFPLLHIEVHGSENFMHFASGEKIHWIIVSNFLSKINDLSKNNLFLVLASCYSINLVRALNILTFPPFYLLIAPSGKVSPQNIEEGFVQFYEILIDGLKQGDRGKSFRKAMEALNEGGKPIFYMVTSEHEFERIWKEFRNQYDTIEKMNRIIDTVLSYSPIMHVSYEQFRKIMITSLAHPEEAKDHFYRCFTGTI
ncbi:MAG: hypothetical protein ACRYFK_07370 [Janthinobacterium lividum]